MDRNWTVLFIGGASGTGKSSLAYEIGRFYGVNVIEAEDIHLSIKTVTTRAQFPAIHYWETGVNWKDIGVEANINWLINVGKEMAPVLSALAERHIEDKLPVIIEGDFISPELTASFDTPEIKSFFLQEQDREQILQNYLAREGGALQRYRAEISSSYNHWIADVCKQKGIGLIESRPWETVLSRAVWYLS